MHVVCAGVTVHTNTGFGDGDGIVWGRRERMVGLPTYPPRYLGRYHVSYIHTIVCTEQW